MSNDKTAHGDQHPGSPLRGHGVTMLHVREATTADLDTINHIITESVSTWDLPERVRRLATPSLCYRNDDLAHMTVLMLEEKDSRGGIGIAAWEEANSSESDTEARAILLHGLYLLPEYQRQGLGRTLFELVEQRVRGEGFAAIAVRAWRESRGFFDALGFMPANGHEDDDRYPKQMRKAIG